MKQREDLIFMRKKKLVFCHNMKHLYKIIKINYSIKKIEVKKKYSSN